MFGVLNLNKPVGKTSRDAVNVVQRIVKPAKVGHAGTLDPMATGVLLVCVGSATRLISLLQQAPKTYVAQFRLGETSDTDDSTGEVEKVTGVQRPDRSELEDVLASFVGKIEQVPPTFSAVKVKGQRAYAKARRGEEVLLSAKSVEVYTIDLLEYSWPELTVVVHCGSGTYIRSIARDLGSQLGCGGLMSALERTAIGDFILKKAVSPDDLTADNLSEHMTDAIHIVSHLPKYRCSADDVALLKTGRMLSAVTERIETSQQMDSTEQSVALVSHDGARLLAMGEFQGNRSQIQPRAVFK